MSAANLYRSVIDDVIDGLRNGRDGEECVDDYTLSELRSLWERKMAASNVLDSDANFGRHLQTQSLLDARMAASQMSAATAPKPPQAIETSSSQNEGNPSDLVAIKIDIPARPSIFAEARTLSIKVIKGHMEIEDMRLYKGYKRYVPSSN